MKKNVFIASIIVLAVITIGSVLYIGLGKNDTPTPTPEGVPVGIGTAHPECQLGGQIVFLSEKLFRSDGAAFNYQKVEDSHDFIRWSISPEESVRIGPNRFTQLSLPDGKENITIAFESGKPQRKAYELSASIDYPYVVNNKVEVLNKKCTGVTKVKIEY